MYISTAALTPLAQSRTDTTLITLMLLVIHLNTEMEFIISVASLFFTTRGYVAILETLDLIVPVKSTRNGMAYVL